METAAFAESHFMSLRERALSQLILQLALHEEVHADLPKSLNISDEQLQAMKGAVAGYERELSNKSPTLSALLGQVAKSKCCT